MANVFFGYDDDFVDLSGRKPKTRIGKALAKTKIGKAVFKKAQKMTPAQKKRVAVIMAMPIPPITKRIMIAAFLKGKAKTKAQKKRAKKVKRIAGTAGAIAAGGITGGIASLVARRIVKKKKAKAKKAKAAEQKRKATGLTVVSTAPVQQQQVAYKPEPAQYATPESIQDAEPETESDAQTDITESGVGITDKKTDMMKAALPVLLGAGALFFMMMQKKK